MTHQPFVSIITVTRNAEKYIEQTMQSVFDQTYSNIEYIIIDGSSTDHTIEIINRHKTKISHTVSEPDNGIYDAMNKGILLSKGELIGLLNASDRYEPNAVETIVKTYRQHPEAGIFHGNVNMLNPDGTFFKLKKPATGQEHLYRGMSLHHPTFFVKRTVYETCGMFADDLHLSADFDFTLRCLHSGITFHYIDATITSFRKGGISAVRQAEAHHECRLALLRNGIPEAAANAAYRRMEHQRRKNHLYETIYNTARKLLPQTIINKLSGHISIK